MSFAVKRPIDGHALDANRRCHKRCAQPRGRAALRGTLMRCRRRLSVRATVSMWLRRVDAVRMRVSHRLAGLREHRTG